MAKFKYGSGLPVGKSNDGVDAFVVGKQFTLVHSALMGSWKYALPLAEIGQLKLNAKAKVLGIGVKIGGIETDISLSGSQRDLEDLHRKILKAAPPPPPPKTAAPPPPRPKTAAPAQPPMPTGAWLKPLSVGVLWLWALGSWGGGLAPGAAGTAAATLATMLVYKPSDLWRRLPRSNEPWAKWACGALAALLAVVAVQTTPPSAKKELASPASVAVQAATATPDAGAIQARLDGLWAAGDWNGVVNFLSGRSDLTAAQTSALDSARQNLAAAQVAEFHAAGTATAAAIPRDPLVGLRTQLRENAAMTPADNRAYTTIKSMRVSGDQVWVETDLHPAAINNPAHAGYPTAQGVCRSVSSYIFDVRNRNLGLTGVRVAAGNGQPIIWRRSATDRCE